VGRVALVTLARNPLADLFRPLRKRVAMRIADYLEERLVAFLDAQDRNGAIDALVEKLDAAGKLLDKDAFRTAIFHREQLVSTGIGMGIAIPHAKMNDFDDFFIMIGIQQKKGLDWNALDGAPVRLVFMIGGPDGKQSEYLQILSMLTAKIKDPELRKALLRAESAKDVIRLFAEK
jgi:PTS system nitrogen regulatory IIA component